MEFSLINLLLVLLAAWLGGAITTRIGYPAVLGELAAGIIFGPAILGILHDSEGIQVLAEVGVFLMMLYIGMEVDHRELSKSSWPGLLAAVGGFITPFVLGYLTTIWFGGTTEAALFVAIAVSVTSLATKSRILVDLHLLGTRIANVLISGALISDTAAIVTFAAVIAVVESGNLNIANLVILTVKAILFFGITIFVGLKVFPYIGRRMIQAGFTQRTANFTLIILVALVFGEMAELAELHSIIGAFLAGLFLREEVLMRKLSHDITSLVHDISIGFLAPIFFVTAGFQVSLDVFKTDLLLMLAIIAVAFIGKILGTALFYLPSGYGWREGLTVGAGMNGRGAVEIIIAGIALKRGIISQEIFSILVFMAFFTTATVPMFLKWGTDWLRGRGELTPSDDKRTGTLIIGAGPTARKLAHALAESQPVSLVDSNLDHCEAATREGLFTVHGNALREEVLEEARVSEARLMIAFTTNPEINILAAQLVREVYLIPETYVLLNPHDQHLLQNILVNMDVYTFGLGKFELPDWDWWVIHGRIHERELIVETEQTPEQLVKESHQKNPFLPFIVSRNGIRSFFYAVDGLKPNDAVTGLSPAQEKI